MSILSKLHNIISADLAELFAASKRASVKAVNDVEQLERQLSEAHQKVIDTATEARQHAEAAAARAHAAAVELEIEAKAAAEKIALHTERLARRDPQL